MNKKYDCLFVAFSGLNLHFAQSILNEKQVNVKLQTSFNAAIAYLCTYLHKRNCSFAYVNSFEDEKERLAELLKNEILVVAISTTFVEDVSTIIEMTTFIRQYNKNCKIVIGGTFISYTINQYEEMERMILMRRLKSDFIIYSYFGEETLYQLIVALRQQKDYSNIANLYYKIGSQYKFTFTRNDRTSLMDNMVDWTLFQDRMGIYTPVRTAISCMYRCAYCSFPKYGGKYQTVNLQEIEKEIQQLKEINRTGIIHFVDDCFNKPASRFKEILRMLVKSNTSMKWHSFLRCEDVDDETIYLMKKSGCLGTLIGLESGSPEMLKRMNKNINLDGAKQIIGKLKEAGILTYALFIVGFPGETAESIRQTVRYIEECAPDFYALSPWYCNINAPIYNKQEIYGIKGRNYEWQHNTMDFITARDYALEMYYNIRNSMMLSLNYTFVFQLLYHGIKGSALRDVVASCNRKISEMNNFEKRKKNNLYGS